MKGSVYLCKRSAAEFWGSTSCVLVRHTPTKSTPKASENEAISHGDIVEACFELGITTPLGIALPRAGKRPSGEFCTYHTWSGPFPEGSFVKTSCGAYVATPELTFLQAASALSMPRLAAYGCELCGNYALPKENPWYDADDPTRASIRLGLVRRECITTVRRLRCFLDRCDGRAGAKKARRAARFLIDGSASPMETALSLLLCLPHRHGGYSLPAPRLNHAIALSKTDAARIGRNVLHCDLYWPDKRIAVEYDSAKHHATDTARQRDATRRNMLLSENVTVFTVTPDQMRSTTKLHALAESLGHALGKPLRIRTQDFEDKNAELHRELLPFWNGYSE